MTDNCEHDCEHICLGCDKSFCEIKAECDLPHEKELSDSMRTNSGDHFCHSDCAESYFS